MSTTHSLDQLTIVGFIDPAGSRNTQLKKQRSSQAIVIVGQDALGRVFCLEAWKDRVPTHQFVDQIFTLGKRYPTISRLGCESNAMQELFSDTVEMLAEHAGLSHLPLEAVKQPTQTMKENRIRLILQPLLGWGRLFIREDHDELRKAILTFPQVELPLMDLVDALASAVNLLPSTVSHRSHDVAVEGLATYFKKAGVPAAVAAQRLDSFSEQQRRGRR